MRATPPPTAMPMMAPVESTGDDDDDGEEVELLPIIDPCVIPYVEQNEAENVVEVEAARVAAWALAWAAV